MNRRRFFARSAMATGALLSLPALAKAGRPPACNPRSFTGGKAHQDTYYSIMLKYCPEIPAGFSTAAKEDKLVILELEAVSKGRYQAEYLMSSAKKNTQEEYLVQASLVKVTDKSLTLPAVFPVKKLVFRLRKEEEYPVTDWLDARNANFATLSMPVGDDEECYITTACTQQLGKGDNCDELQTLRQFRDGYLLRRPGGRGEVDLYYTHAPAIVREINASENGDAIYTHIYRNMILPVLDLVKTGQHAEAAACYRLFTEGLYQQFVSGERS
jgi:hypothetical protein